MAEGLPTPKSREQIVSDMLKEYVGLTGINDLNVGSVMTQFFDVVARSIARTSGDIFQILRDFSLDRATGEALNRIGSEERVFRTTSQVSDGKVQVTDTSFQKISSKIYSGASAPNIGTTVIRVSDASSFPATGRVYIGRGTPNIEGPINYSAVAQVGAFWEVTLSTPTSKFHNISESVIVGQGGTRNVPVNSTVISPGAGATANIIYSVSSAALLLDGENVNNNVLIASQEPGSASNAPAGAIRQFGSLPFPNASVINISPLTTGLDEESDDDYRDRIKKERLSRGLGTALAVKNAVLGAQAPDENARVTSNEIDTANPEETILYIDNGSGYEEKSEGVGFEFVVDSAIGGEQSFQLTTGGSQTSVAKAFIESSNSSPFDIRSFEKLSILVGGIVSEHTFTENAFQAQGAATAFEIVANINDNPNLTFEATTAESGTKVVIRAKSENDEFLEMTSPSVGIDAAPKLNFPSNEINTVLLYRNRELLNKNGRSAFLTTKDQFSWSNSITNGDTLIISVDGTDSITYTFLDQDFQTEGQQSTVSNQNTLSSWANVINAKVTGVTAEVNSEQLKLTSNLGSSNRASISIDPSSDLVLKGMFSPESGLFREGNEADFQISRNTAQIKLNTPLSEGESLNLGSEFTRAEIQSKQILGGQTTLSGIGYVWLIVDGSGVQPVETGVTGDTFLDVTKPGGNIVRYESTNLTAFDNVQVGDYVNIWSDELSATNRLEGRVNAVTSSTLDIKVTAAEEAAAVIEGPIFFSEGFTVLRTVLAPQKIKIPAGVYNINEIASIMNDQLENAVVSIDNDEIFVFRTNTESTTGSVYLADFNDPAKALNLIKNSSSQSIASQSAFYETGFKDRQFPAFVHGKITADAYADPSDSYINAISVSEDLNALGLDPSGFVCLAQPYSDTQDILSSDCIEIERYTGSVVSLENSYFYKRSRIDDRFYVLNPYDFGHNDSLVTVLDDDPTGKTFDMPLYRTAVTNITAPANANNFRAYDVEGGDADFEQFFGTDFKFDNYKALMQAKNVIDPLSATNEDAILFRSVEWGRSGEKFGVGYYYPTTPDSEIQHIVTVGEQVNIQLFLKSGPVRTTTINGTTEWNITITPAVGYDLVTYAYSGEGAVPGLNSINSGDYVSVINTGEFSAANQGAYRVDSASATSFTVRRSTGEAEVQSNVASLEINTISFFEPADTTAQEIVDYVTLNLTDHITSEIVDDNGLSGAGVISQSTSEDSNFAYEYVYFKDGKNYLLSSDITSTAPAAQFVFKTPLDLPTFSTNTADAYSFNNGEQVKLVPITSLQLQDFLNVLAVTGYTTIGKIKSVNRNTDIQLSTDILGTEGAVQIAGGTGSLAAAAIQGSASTIGNQDNESSIVTILSAGAVGFHSDQWVKLFASEVQRKNTLINNLNSIEISNSEPSVGFSKIELFNRSISQRFFGRNRYHTRTRGRTFKVEKHGQFACFSWNEVGTEPYFVKTVELNDIDTSDISVTVDFTTSLVDYTIESGSISFAEVQIGDIVNITNFSAAGNNGAFKAIGVSVDGKSIRVRNPNAVETAGNVNEIQSIRFSSVPTIGEFTLNFDGQITAAIPYNAVAANVETALENLSNIDDVTVTGDFATGFLIEFAGVNTSTDVSNLIVQTNTLDGSGNNITIVEEVKGSLSGDFAVQTEVQEGDTVTISSDFSILNQGNFRVIRRFENSIYIDNPNTIEEEVTIGDNLISIGYDGSTDFDIDKLDGVSKIKWAGAGAEPAFEDTKSGNIITLGTDFNAANQGSFQVVDSGDKLQQITRFTQSRGVDMVSGQHALLNSAEDATNYYIWYNIQGAGGDPAPGGTGIEIPVLTADLAAEVAVKKADVINASFSADFTAVVDGDDVIVTTTGYGETTPSSNVDITGPFSLETTQVGRRNFVDYINVAGVSETGVTVSDILEIHEEAMAFKEYEGVIAGDTFVISSNFLGENNVGSYTVQEVLSETEIIVSGVTESVSRTLLDSNFNKIYIEESTPYVGYKQIDLIATNPANLNTKNVVFSTFNQFQKIGELAGVSMTAVGKLEFPSEIIRGVDAYKFNTGLIGEANRIVYGDPRDNTTYPGVSAAGAEIFIKAPLVKRIEVSINVRVKTGIPFTTIVEEVRNSIAALINSNPVGQPIAISNIISNVDAIIGIQAVAISSPQYDPQNDVIRVNSGEKALVLDIIADILVSKID